METAQREALVRWLLSGARPPAELARKLRLSATRHALTAWRFQGMWARAYAGQIGRLREHQQLTRPGDPPAEVPKQASADLTMVDIDGEESGPFDVAALEGEAPEPPERAWYLRAARGADAWAEVPGDQGRWEALGAKQVDAIAEEGLKRALGRPEILSLERRDRIAPTTTSRAEVTFWEITGEVAGKPLRCVVGPDGSVWGEPPSSDLPQPATPVLLLGAGYTLAALVGLLLFVVPGLIIGAIGAAHVQRRLQAKTRQEAAVRRAVERVARL